MQQIAGCLDARLIHGLHAGRADGEASRVHHLEQIKRLLAESDECKEEEEDLPSPYRNRFKNEEDLLNYYELKAVDVGDNFEGEEELGGEEDDSYFYEQINNPRKPSWQA